MTLAIRATIANIHGALVCTRVYEAPNCSPASRDHSDDSPIRAEVLDSPDDGDYNRDEGEGAPVTGADEGSGYVG